MYGGLLTMTSNCGICSRSAGCQPAFLCGAARSRVCSGFCGERLSSLRNNSKRLLSINWMRSATLWRAAVPSSYFESLARNIRGYYLGMRKFVRQSDAKQPEPVPMSAICSGAFLRSALEALKSHFDHVLGLGAGNQDSRSHFEIQSPEFLLAGQILRGGAARRVER